MVNEPFVSVLIVCYNYARFLPDTLQALKGQTYRDFEIVMVDNGSEDESLSIMNEFCKKNKEIRTKVIEIETNEGLPKGRNAGLDAATGTYVIYNDADDWMEPECLEMLVAAAKENDADIAVGDINFVYSDGRAIFYDMSKDVCKWTISALQCSLLRRSLFVEHNIRFLEGAFYDDFTINCLLDAVIKKENYCFKRIYNMRFHTTSMTARRDDWSIEKTPRRFGDTLLRIVHLQNELATPFDSMMFEYKVIMKYYTEVMDCKGYSLKEMMVHYRLLKETMKENFPKYLKNKNIKFSAPNHYYGGFKKNIWMLSKAEKVDGFFRFNLCMRIILAVYGFSVRRGLYKK